MLIQRLPDKHDDDATYARWEFPGGCLDDTDPSVWDGALREWEEETGATLGEDAGHAGSFLSPDGHYQAYVVTIPAEAGLELDPQAEEVANIDWWNPGDLQDDRVRDKVQECLPALRRFLAEPAVKGTPPAGFHQHTDRIVEYYAPLIQQAIASLATDDLIQAGVDAALASITTHAPQVPRPQAIKRATLPSVPAIMAVLRALLAHPTQLTNPVERMKLILTELHGDAALQGAHEAAAAAGGQPPRWIRPAMTGLPDGYWNDWQPGWGQAAAQLADGGLKRLLERQDATIRGLVDTTLTRLGDTIAEGVAQGDSVDTIARQSRSIINDPKRAWMIADTEVARAMTATNQDTYQELGVPMVRWIAEATACAACQANEAASPIPTGAGWPNGTVPVHPRCRCAVAPHITL